MKIDARLKRIEDKLVTGDRERPFVLVLSAGSRKGDPEYEARLQRRIEEAIRDRPHDKFILLM